jgi:hypothetical protein
MNNRPVGGRSSERYPHSIDMMMMMIIIIMVHWVATLYSLARGYHLEKNIVSIIMATCKTTQIHNPQDYSSAHLVTFDKRHYK